jgi:hypothetical protein
LLSHLHRIKSGGASGGPNVHHLAGNQFSNTAEMEKATGSSGFNGFGRGRGTIRNMISHIGKGRSRKNSK